MCFIKKSYFIGFLSCDLVMNVVDNNFEYKYGTISLFNCNGQHFWVKHLNQLTKKLNFVIIEGAHCVEWRLSQIK
jgi:hypothetical protein